MQATHLYCLLFSSSITKPFLYPSSFFQLASISIELSPVVASTALNPLGTIGFLYDGISPLIVLFLLAIILNCIVGYCMVTVNVSFIVSSSSKVAVTIIVPHCSVVSSPFSFIVAVLLLSTLQVISPLSIKFGYVVTFSLIFFPTSTVFSPIIFIDSSSISCILIEEFSNE